MKFYDEIDAAGNTVRSGFALGPYDSLPDGHRWVEQTVSIGELIEATKSRVRTLRSTVFSTLAGIQCQALADGDMDTAKAISSIQDQLKNLPDIDLSKCTTQADIDTAFAAAWVAIAASAPQNVSNAFNSINLVQA